MPDHEQSSNISRLKQQIYNSNL